MKKIIIITIILFIITITFILFTSNYRNVKRYNNNISYIEYYSYWDYLNHNLKPNKIIVEDDKNIIMVYSDKNKINNISEKYIDTYIEILNDTNCNFNIRIYAIEALSGNGNKSCSAIPIIKDKIRDKNENIIIRTQLCYALCEISNSKIDILTILLEVKNSNTIYLSNTADLIINKINMK
jgi:hypothetical protein